MINLQQEFYLASQSPRRKKLLQQIGIKPNVLKLEFDEELIEKESPLKTVRRLSVHKMDTAKKVVNNGIILTADTIVVLKNTIIGKPRDENDAFRILNLLSGKTHFVYTGFVLYNSSSKLEIFDYEKTAVTFRIINANEITEYIQSGSPMDKAGAYGIQDDYGAVFVKKISGCYYNVVGLPLAKVFDTLQKIK
jgi:septum formation protein